MSRQDFKRETTGGAETATGYFFMFLIYALMNNILLPNLWKNIRFLMNVLHEQTVTGYAIVLPFTVFSISSDEESS